MQHIVDLQLLSSHLLTWHEPDPDVGPLSWEEDASDRLHLKVFWRGFLPHLPPYMEGHVFGDLREGEGHCVGEKLLYRESFLFAGIIKPLRT